MTAARALALTLLFAIVAVAVHDLARDSCDRISIRARAWMFRVIGLDPGATPTASLERPLEGYVVDDPWKLLGAASGARWKDVQTAEITAVGDFRLLLVTPPWWRGDPRAYLEEFERIHGTARPLATTSSVPAFLLLQQGGGVEGLTRQSLLTRDGTTRIWNLEMHSEADRLAAPRRARLEKAAANRLFELAAAAGFPPGQTRFEGRCEMLDGSVTALTYFDGERLGRIQFNGGREPSGALADLIAELERARPAPSEDSECERR